VVPCATSLAAAAIVLVAAGARAATPTEVVRRGEYLARAADGAACHTSPDGRDYVGRRPFKLPFGTLYAPNITPDRTTGIGNYTDEEFVAALREGRGRGGKHLYPAMR
jgi:hypothetical protein